MISIFMLIVITAISTLSVLVLTTTTMKTTKIIYSYKILVINEAS